MTDYRNVTACRLCDSPDLTEALKLPDTPLANELDGTELFPLVVNRCGSCGHHQLSIAVNPERLWGPAYPYASGTSPVFRKHLEALADEVAALKPGGRVLEIASNDGTLCRMLSTRGLRAQGTDPSGPQIAETGPGHSLWLDQYAWPDSRFDVLPRWDIILALNVFAHVDDLHSFTAAVKEALAPDGLFCIEVGYLPEQIKRGQFDTIYSEHMSYFTLRPLFAFFERHGLTVQAWHEVESQGGSIRVWCEHAGRPAWPQNRDWEHPGVDARLFRPLIDSRAAALRSALNALFHRGEMVCIYGAPAKLTTLLYATGLEKMPFGCVFDDNPRKIGRTTPGMHLPIVSSDELMQRNPDTIIVASWNFYEDINKKVRSMGYKGGVINPMYHSVELERAMKLAQQVGRPRD